MVDDTGAISGGVASVKFLVVGVAAHLATIHGATIEIAYPFMIAGKKDTA